MERKNFMLSPHFSYEEMTHSAWAERHGVENTPDELQLAGMINICWKLGEPLREVFGPIRINSGFRSPVVNEGVGGVGNSKHLSGEAMDIYLSSEEIGKEYFMFIQKNIDFDQLFFEYNSRVGASVLHTRKGRQKWVLRERARALLGNLMASHGNLRPP